MTPHEIELLRLYTLNEHVTFKALTQPSMVYISDLNEVTTYCDNRWISLVIHVINASKPQSRKNSYSELPKTSNSFTTDVYS